MDAMVFPIKSKTIEECQCQYIPLHGNFNFDERKKEAKTFPKLMRNREKLKQSMTIEDAINECNCRKNTQSCGESENCKSLFIGETLFKLIKVF